MSSSREIRGNKSVLNFTSPYISFPTPMYPLVRTLDQQQVFERFRPTVLVAVCSDSLAPARMLRQLYRQD